MKAEVNEAVQTEAAESTPERAPVQRKPGHYVVRQMNGICGPVIIGEYTDENSWRDAQDKFRNTHGYLELWQFFTGPKGIYRHFISAKKSSGRILN